MTSGHYVCLRGWSWASGWLLHSLFFTVYNSWPYHRLLVFQVFSVLNEWRWIRNLDCLWLLGIIDGSSLGYIRPPKVNMPMIEIEAQVHWFGGYKSTIAASWWFFESSSSDRITPTAVVSIRIQSRANIKTANFWNWRMVTSDGFLKKKTKCGACVCLAVAVMYK